MLKCRLGNFFPVFVSAAVLLFAVASYAESPKSLFESTCSRCHQTDIIMMKKGRSEQAWIATIDKMKSAGLQISAEDQKTIAGYLAATLK